MAGNPRIDELRKKLDKEPGSRLFAQLAEELRKDGDLEDAIRVAREGLQKHSNYPSARMTLGRALYDTGDWAAARAEFELVLKGAPDNILASRLLAESLEGLGDVPAAIARYKKTLALAPGDKQVLGRLEALEAAGGAAAPAGGVPGSPAAAAASPAPIRVAEVDTPMELEQSHERATVFSAGPAAPTAPAPSPAVVETPAAPPAVASPPPIPVSAADEEFELERPYEAPRAAEAPVPVSPPRPAAPAPPPARAAESLMEFEFDAGPTVGTIPFAPPPAPAPPGSAPAPPPQEAAPTVPAIVVPPPAPAPQPVAEPAPEPAAAPPAAALPERARVEAPPPAAPPADPVPAPASPSDELTSATLAELYFKQGFTEKAVEVYRQLIQRDPENDRLHRRLAEIQHARPAAAVPADVAPPAPVPAAGGGAATGPDPASRRLALERTIAKLEGMLSAIKKG